jgi:hypothetical protein
VVVGNEKVLGLNAEDEVTALPVFEFPVDALKLNGLRGLLGSAWATFVAGIEAEADVLLKKGVEVDPLVAVFTAGLAVVVDPVGALEKKFGRVVDVAGAVTISEDGAVTVIFGTWAASFAFLSASAFSFSIRSFSALSLSSRSFSSLACSAAARSAFSLSSFSLASRSSSFLRLASLIFIIACASSSCFSHLEKALLAVRELPLVPSGRPGGPLRTDKLVLLVDEMRFTGGI